MTARVLEIVSEETRKIFEFLAEINEGGEVSYEEIATALGKQEFTTKLRGSLAAARKRLIREKGIVFGVNRAVGLKRLTPAEIVDASRGGIHRVSRQCRRSMKTLGCADFQRLSADEKIKHNASMSIYGALAASSSLSSIKRIETVVKNSGEILSLSATIDHFK